MDEADSPVYIWFVCTYSCRILVKQTHAVASAPLYGYDRLGTVGAVSMARAENLARQQN